MRHDHGLAASDGWDRVASVVVVVVTIVVRSIARLPAEIGTSFLPQEQRQAQFAAAAGMIPAGRVGHAGDVAGAVRYLISAPYVTGTILPVDGGFTAA